MSPVDTGAAAGLLLLGAVHGLNPGMGWLFAVALGLQERNGRAVWRALGPLALGHGAAIGLAVAVALLLGAVIPVGALRWVVAVLLLGLGVQRLRRSHVHGRLAGLHVNARQLASWSFLMASAHGAGLMVLPLLLGGGSRASAAGGHGMHAAHTAPALAGFGGAEAGAFFATALHSAGYLAVTALLALVVYHRFGLRLLRTAWINLDAIWAAALVATAVLTVLV